MKNSFTINDAINIGNTLISIVPKLMGLVYFVAVLTLIVFAFKQRGKLGIMEAAAIAIALGLGMK